MLLSLGAANGQQEPADYAVDGIPRRHRAAVPMIRWPAERAPVSPKGSSKRRLPASIHRIRITALSSQTGAKRCSKRPSIGFISGALFVLCLVLGASLLGNGWLLRERERRLTISADIVAQLFNAYVGSRAKALEVIGKHNALVERYNRLNDDRSALASQLASDR